MEDSLVLQNRWPQAGWLRVDREHHILQVQGSLPEYWDTDQSPVGVITESITLSQTDITGLVLTSSVCPGHKGLIQEDMKDMKAMLQTTPSQSMGSSMLVLGM